MNTQTDFQNKQDVYFDKAETEKFLWQTHHPFISASEKTLLPEIDPHKVKSLLEIGCGEGGNLVLLERRPRLTVGLDFYQLKVKFAKSQLKDAHFVAADGQLIPFQDETFDLVLIRDILHHVVDSGQILNEAYRVLRTGGELFVIEANGNNPLVNFFGLIVPAEKLVLRTRPEWINEQMTSLNQKASVTVAMSQPFPLFRAVLHYRFGLPWLIRIPGITLILKLINAIASKLVPKKYWAYITARLVKGVES